MKKLLLISILLFPLGANTEEKVIISLSDVVKRVSENNYTVYENALKVYQAKASVERARADLLPKLNLWSIAKVVIDPTSVIDVITDAAPFLVPANWFRAEETRLLFLANKEGYRALWGNELHAAKALFHNVLLDLKLLRHIQTSITDLNEIFLIAKTREMFGGAAPGTARDIEIKMLGLQEDEKNVILLVQEEFSALSYALGYPLETAIALNPIEMPAFEQLPLLKYETYEFRLLANSPERRQFDHFLSALGQVENEITYSFLGGSSMSRGTAGGVFDNLPTPDGLGFGQGPAMKIVKAQREILLTQKRGVEETLKRQLKRSVNFFNSDLNNYGSFTRRAMLTRESKQHMMKRVQMGEDVNIAELAEVSRNQIQAETSLYAVRYRMLVSLDKLDRLIFDNDYSMPPPVIESLKGGKQ